MPEGLSIRRDAAQEVVLACIAKGMGVRDACKAAARSEKTYENWRALDPEFKRKVDDIREKRNFRRKNGQADEVGRQMSFADWRRQYLDRETYPHQQMWIDLLEDREPQGLHPEMVFEKNKPNRILINTPPFHAKSTILTQEYVVYRICMNPMSRICIISKTQDKAKKFLFSCKKMLTGGAYARLQAAYAPPEGFRHPDYPWTANKIYVDNPEGSEKDPTIEALGIKGDIYGGRYDLVIMDDCITKENYMEFDKQIDWINQEVASRLFKGKIVVVGTRVGSVDLYSELRNPDNFSSGKSSWTYLAQPAVLEFAEDAKDWVTLWPRSNAPLDMEEAGDPDENGTWAAWDGPALKEVRDSIRAGTWSLVYMQQQVNEDSTFNQVCVNASINRMRRPGPLIAGAVGHNGTGMEGQYVIASMDPAMTGDTFTLVMAVDKNTQMRRILNCYVKHSPTPLYIRDLIKQLTDEYEVNEWVIEQNAFQLFLVYDPEVRSFLNSRGIKITPHYTSRNKIDPDFGVASVAPLFGSLKVRLDGRRSGMDHLGDNLIELPRQDNEGMKELINQLITWQPGKLGKQLKQDGPMALWFAELRAREILGVGRRTRKHFIDNPYLSRGDKAKQTVVPLSAYRYSQTG
jgi:hypothetical protein